MAEDKAKTDVAAPTPEWVNEQCEKFERVLTGYTQAMREHFRKKAAEGRAVWERPEFAPKLYQAMLAHAAATSLAAGHEAHCGNFLAFLWYLRTTNPEATAVSPAPRPLPMASGYGVRADLQLVRHTLDQVADAVGGETGEKIRRLQPEAVIAELDKAAA